MVLLLAFGAAGQIVAKQKHDLDEASRRMTNDTERI
jgi:hypothetical protein